MRMLRKAQTGESVHISSSIAHERYNLFFNTTRDTGKLVWKAQPWHVMENNVKERVYLASVKTPQIVANPIYTYRLIVIIYPEHRANFTLFINIGRSLTGAGEQIVGTWEIKPNPHSPDEAVFFFKGEGMHQYFLDQFGISDFHYPEEEVIDTSAHRPRKLQLAGEPVEEGIRLTRMRDSFGPATELYIYIVKNRDGYAVAWMSKNIETEVQGTPKRIKSTNERGQLLSWDEALKVYNQQIEIARSNKNYVDDTSSSYIPEWANEHTWDFILNIRKQHPSTETPSGTTPSTPSTPGETEEGDTLLKDLFGRSNKRIVIAQDFGGYFTGSVPEYGASMLGTGMVDASQIKSFFGKADMAIRLVNEFDSSLLSNVSFIFNFSKGGAYGVYLSELDRAIKTSALKKELEGRGYKIETSERGLLTAYPTHGDKTPEQIQSDIDTLYQGLQSKGGSAFGINMNSVLSAAKMDAQQVKSPDPNIWEWMAVLHLGGTLVHEAIHAKGSHDEGPSEAGEENFIRWALPKINEEYRRVLESGGHPEWFAPLIMGTGKRHAKKRTWYRQAQNMGYIPNAIFGKPQGSDLHGRFPSSVQSDIGDGMAEWAKMMQQGQDLPIEKRLSREFMFPLPKTINQSHDSTEEQLRKNTEYGPKLDTTATTEELLYTMHDEAASYRLTEQLLEDKRPKPLIIPIQKKASIDKVATLFGWYNNLDLADGNTIPGLSDRVMLWSDADEDFREEERWIKRQPRYNPTQDIKGFYYRWIEPRFRPTLFDDLTRDLVNSSPALRFASKTEIPDDLIKIISLLSSVMKKLSKRSMSSARFMMTKDIIPLVSRLFHDMEYGIKVIPIIDADPKDLMAVWIYLKDLNENEIEEAENYINRRSNDGIDRSMEEKVDKLLGFSSCYEQVTKSVLNLAKELCQSSGITEMYVLGAYPRVRAMPSNKLVLPNTIDFSSSFANQSVKMGWAMAEKLGVDLASVRHNEDGVSFPYQGLVLSFNGTFIPEGIKNQMEELGIKVNPLNVDVYNRDFTLNMMAYDVLQEKLVDLTGHALEDIKSKNIRTFFDAPYICRQNPMSMLRAVLLKMQYDDFDIDEALQLSIIENHNLLFDGRYTSEQLSIAREKILLFGKDKATNLLDNLGLEYIFKV